ncbi:putative membrane protein YkgB [Pedobacter sp. UYEF25]
MENLSTNTNSQNWANLQKWGFYLIRYGLALVLIWIGILKFTPYEAEGIAPLASNSPVMSWLPSMLGVVGFAKLLGVIEITTGLLICCRPFMAILSAWGSVAAAITFLITLTFLFSTPGIVQPGYSFPFISPMPGQFIIKDVVLLGASLYTAGEAFTDAGGR